MAFPRVFAPVFALLLLPATAEGQADEIFYGVIGASPRVGVVHPSGSPSDPSLITDVFALGLAINPLTSTGTLYISDASRGSILACAADGSDASAATCTTVVSTPMVSGIAIDLLEPSLYWGRFSTGGQLERSDLAGGGRASLWTVGLNPWDVEIDLLHEQVYWTEPFSVGPGGRSVRRANLDGVGSIQNVTVPDAFGEPRGIALDPVARRVYFTDAEGNRILAGDVSGALPLTVVNVEVLVDDDDDPSLAGMVKPWDIELDVGAEGGGYLYWTTIDGIWRSRPDGSEATQIHAPVLAPDEELRALVLHLPIANDGEPCTTPDLCRARSCVDGVCCAVECDELCYSCNTLDTGMPSGECHPATERPGAEVLCDDLEACTADFCVAEGARLVCENRNLTGDACEDGDPCTAGDVCAAGACISGETFVCDAGPPDAGPFDAGGRTDPDAGAPSGSDAGVAWDATVEIDGGAGTDEGCGCRAVVPTRGESAPLVVLAFLGAARRRRSRS